MLWPSIFATLVDFLSQFAVLPLNVLKTLLLSLSLIYRVRQVEEAIGASACLGGKRVWSLTGHIGEDCVFLTGVPVAFIVEVQVAHIVARNFGNFLTIFVNFAPHVVLLAESVSIMIVVADQAIYFVREGDFASELVKHGAEEHA